MLSRLTTNTVPLLLSALLLSAGFSPSMTASPAEAAPPKPGASHPVGDFDKSKSQSSTTDKKPETKAETKPEPVIENVVGVSPDDLVNKPQEFLGKNVKFNASFFAWSNLALDYKPAFRSSKTHVSFLILKPNSHIPLSELKLAMMIPKEKDPEAALFATLKDGDQVELVGKVFSSALDDPWVEVLKLKKLGGTDDKDKDKDKKTASTDSKSNDEKPGDHPDIDKSGGSSDTKKQ